MNYERKIVIYCLIETGADDLSNLSRRNEYGQANKGCH